MNNNEKHQFCFAFMNTYTGGQKTKTFWGNGDKEAAKAEALTQAKVYLRQYEQQLNAKARARNTSRYAPSHISVEIVGCSCWR